MDVVRQLRRPSAARAGSRELRKEVLHIGRGSCHHGNDLRHPVWIGRPGRIGGGRGVTDCSISVRPFLTEASLLDSFMLLPNWYGSESGAGWLASSELRREDRKKNGTMRWRVHTWAVEVPPPHLAIIPLVIRASMSPLHHFHHVIPPGQAP